jgi:ferric-dicitrate binding protein FerR (iron transport regulator)
MAPATRLRVPDDFGIKTRSLLIEGEAYFDVVHDQSKPFSVRSPNTTTRDLGTAFAITDYPGETIAHVLVAEGQVAVLSPRDSTASTLQVLNPGELAAVSVTGTVSRTRVVNIKRRLAWVRGGLAFDDVLLGDAIHEIERWYDLDIHLANHSLESLRLTATIDDEPAEDVLGLVALALDLRFVRQGRTVTFYSKRAR